MSNHIMKAIVLYLGLNFENKLSEVHDLKLKYLTPEQEPINKIIKSQSWFYSCFFRVSPGSAANTANRTCHDHNLGLHFFGVSLLTFSFILYMFSLWCLLFFIFRIEIRIDLKTEHRGFPFLKSLSRKKGAVLWPYDIFWKHVCY